MLKLKIIRALGLNPVLYATLNHGEIIFKFVFCRVLSSWFYYSIKYYCVVLTTFDYVKNRSPYLFLVDTNSLYRVNISCVIRVFVCENCVKSYINLAIWYCRAINAIKNLILVVPTGTESQTAHSNIKYFTSLLFHQ